MDETMVGVAMGLSVLLIATLLVVGHYRREHLRQRMIRAMGTVYTISLGGGGDALSA
jgi:hypothetical protein